MTPQEGTQYYHEHPQVEVSTGSEYPSVPVHELVADLRRSIENLLRLFSAGVILSIPSSADAVRSAPPQPEGVHMVEPGKVPPEMMEQYLETVKALEAANKNETVIYDSASR